MELPIVNANCSRCYRRPREEGGSGSCPKVGVHRDIYIRRGDHNGCESFDEREYLSPATKRDLRDHPQEAALF